MRRIFTTWDIHLVYHMFTNSEDMSVFLPALTDGASYGLSVNAKAAYFFLKEAGIQGADGVRQRRLRHPLTTIHGSGPCHAAGTASSFVIRWY